jgi:chain length determinant protein tyrosine kinase EpsG
MQNQGLTSFSKIKPEDTSIGQLLQEMGKINVLDVAHILSLQKAEGLQFGEAAIKLGLITEADIRQVLSMQFDYPYRQTGQGTFSQELAAVYQPFSPQVEALRVLRSQLVVRWFTERATTLAVVGAQAGDGSTYIAANLAVVFSQLGEKTLLIDANLRTPRQRQIFNLQEKRGLSDILAGRANQNAIVRIETFMGLSVLGAGTIPPNPQELLSRPIFNELLAYTTDHYDVVIIDTSPAAESADFQAIVARAGGALMVSRKNHTKVSDLTRLRDQIRSSGAQVVGAVLNDY